GAAHHAGTAGAALKEAAAAITGRAAIVAERGTGLGHAAVVPATLTRHAAAAAGLRTGAGTALDRATAAVADWAAIRARGRAGAQAARRGCHVCHIVAGREVVGPAADPHVVAIPFGPVVTGAAGTQEDAHDQLGESSHAQKDIMVRRENIEESISYTV